MCWNLIILKIDFDNCSKGAWWNMFLYLWAVGFFYLHSIEFYLYYLYLTVTEIIVGDSNYKKSLLISLRRLFV